MRPGKSTPMSTMDTKLQLAPMTLADLDEVVAIERVSFPTPWTPAAFRYEIQQNRVARCSVMRAGRQVVGYLCLWEIGHEIHITNLAVHLEWRHRGVGRAILAAALSAVVARGVTLAFLEVLPRHAPAGTLYRSPRFHIIGRPSSYYFNTGED